MAEEIADGKFREMREMGENRDEKNKNQSNRNQKNKDLNNRSKVKVMKITISLCTMV